MRDQVPQSLEAEMAVLGCVMLDPPKLYELSVNLSASDFYFERNRAVYMAMLRMVPRGETTDIANVGSELRNSGEIEKVGGMAYLVSLLNSVPTASNAKHYANQVKDKSLRRQLLSAQSRNEPTIYDEGVAIDTVLAEAQKNVMAVSNVSETDDSARSIIGEVEKVQKEYAEKYKKGQRLLGYSCGFGKVDDIIDGVRPGHIWVVGAWTSTGKTQFALNVVNAVLEQNVPVAIISLEMSRVDTLARLMGIRNEVSSMAILKGKHDLEMFERVEEAKAFYRYARLEIHTTYFDIEKIKMLIRRDAMAKGVRFVVVDYVQNIISDDGLREYDLVTKAATDLQALARELAITIYIVSQISNESEKGSGAGAGFKGTGALEAVADLAIKLKRDRKNEAPQELAVPIEIIVTKNRHGFTGAIKDYQLWLKTGRIKPKPEGL